MTKLDCTSPTCLTGETVSLPYVVTPDPVIPPTDPDLIVDVKFCTVCRIDFVAPCTYTSYVERFRTVTTQAGVTTTSSDGLFTNDCFLTPYSPQGVDVEAGEIGEAAVVKQFRDELVGLGSWSPCGLTRAYTIRVDGGSPTFTDSSGGVTTLQAGEELSYTYDQGAMFDPTTKLVTDAGDSVVITYLKLGV